MNIFIDWHGDNFNVNLSNGDADQSFLSIKGCRIANGSKGEFVSWPSTKNANTGKWWNHVWAGEKFAAIVLSKANQSRPRQEQRRADDDMADVPF